MKSFASARALAVFVLTSLTPVSAMAAHPLLTEDTGTQGAGRFQIEAFFERSHHRDAGTDQRVRQVNVVLSVGLADTADLILGLPYERVTERTGGTATTVSGIADGEVALKWRLYEDGPLSIALRPGLSLPTGNASRGLGYDRYIPSLFGVMSYETAPWAFHLHLGYTGRFPDAPGLRAHVTHASAALAYSFNDRLRVVGDMSAERNLDRTGHPTVGSMLVGLIYAVTPDFDLDLGYRTGLTDAAPRHAWLAGMAWRF